MQGEILGAGVKRLFTTVLLLIVMVLSSCKTKKLVVGDRLILPIKTAVLIDTVQHQALNFDLLSAKLAIKYSGSQKMSLKGNLRMKKDSVIWISLSPGLGIEAARMLIGTEGVKFMNRIEKNYALYSYEELSEKFNTTLNFTMIQAFLMGNHMLPLNKESMYSDIPNQSQYRISNFTDRQLRKIKKDRFLPEELIYMLLVHPENYRPEAQLLEDKINERSLEIKYQDYTKLNNSYLPEKIDISIIAKEKSEVKISMSKIETPSELKFHFRIPSKYEEVH